MKINWIEVENFKGFDKRRFEFDEHFTLIVGGEWDGEDDGGEYDLQNPWSLHALKQILMKHLARLEWIRANLGR